MIRTLIAAALGMALLTGCAVGGQQSVGGTTGGTTGRTVTLRAGFQPDPHIVPLAAGGTFAASARSASCSGYIADAPDVTLNFTGTGGDLHIFVEAEKDTTLVVRAPNGTWYCNDDDDLGDTWDPWITVFRAATGRYSIWVGTFTRGSYPAATLYISEFDLF